MKTKNVLLEQLKGEREFNPNMNMTDAQINDLVQDVDTEILMKCLVDEYSKVSKKYEVEVKVDYDSQFAWEYYKDDLIYLSEELDIAVHNSNRRMGNVLPNKKIDTDGYHKSCIVGCTGYSQSEWDDYKIYYNEESEELDRLKEELSKVFTHKHDYQVDTIEVLDSGHSMVIESDSVSIMHIEFPEEDDVKAAILDANTGIDIDSDLVTWNFAI
tara:strand:+ start:850 stop:1491 length:642 start_codon:yes stop_codon:yes gene_type:complete